MKNKYIIPFLMCFAALAASCTIEPKSPEEELSGEVVTLEATIGTPETRIHFEGDKGTYTATSTQAFSAMGIRISCRSSEV